MSGITFTELSDILRASKNIAVVGASPNPARPSNWISEYLMGNGYKVFPVNPGHDQLFGVACYADLTSIEEPVEIVNIFRRSDTVLPIVKDALEGKSLKLIWMQDNVFNQEAADLASQNGIPVVMNDCIYRFHSRLETD